MPWPRWRWGQSRSTCQQPRQPGSCRTIGPCPRTCCDRVTLAYICSPANPQGAVASRDYLAGLLALAEQHDFCVLADECYSEIWNEAPPPGVLQVADAVGADPERALAFHSLSKRSNLPGSAVGLRGRRAGGHGAASASLRAFAGAPLPLPLQRVSERAWAGRGACRRQPGALSGEVRAMPRRSSRGCRGIRLPEGGFFLWLPVDDGEAAALKVWRETGVRVLPGAYLSRDVNGDNPGKGYVRVALVAPREETQRGLIRLRDCLYG